MLLFAMSRAIGLPTFTTMREALEKVWLVPRIGLVKRNDILANIETFYPANVPGPAQKCGHTLMFDEISLEERPCYMKWANSVGGLCREHSKYIDLRITDKKALDKIVDAVTGKTQPVIMERRPRCLRLEHFESMTMVCVHLWCHLHASRTRSRTVPI